MSYMWKHCIGVILYTIYTEQQPLAASRESRVHRSITLLYFHYSTIVVHKQCFYLGTFLPQTAEAAVDTMAPINYVSTLYVNSSM